MVLYINGNYPYHSLHGELVSKLCDLGKEITVYVPIKGKELDGKYLCQHYKSKIIYEDYLSTLDRIFFVTKVKRIARRIEETVDISKVDCILAGTVYSDGAVAYLLHKKFNIPFAVAVRETDVTYQMKWRPYLNGFIKRLLNAATKVIFLSPAYIRFLEKFGCTHEKYITIPNAVNDYWFQNQPDSRSIHDPVSLIYVGEISKRKNVETTIRVVAELRKQGISSVLHIVGSGDEEQNCKLLAGKLEVTNQVYFHGWQNGKEKIKEFYDQADIFVMPSFRETFGTVYIEALSQGLPVIYTKGQGIDGYFEDGEVGYGCDPNDIQGIAEKIILIMSKYRTESDACINKAKNFEWDVVARQYYDVLCDTKVHY